MEKNFRIFSTGREVFRLRVESNRGGRNRIYNRSPMQTEKYQPKGKRMMPETRFTEQIQLEGSFLSFYSHKFYSL